MVAVSGRIVLDRAIAGGGTSIGVVSNGYVVVGGGTSAEGVAVTNWRPVAQSVLK